MSLIDEALRRARQEAARQDAARREAQYRQVPVYAPPARRDNRPLLIGAVIALCVAAGIGIGVFLGRGKSAAPETPGPEPRPAAQAPEAPPEPSFTGPVTLEETPETTEPEPTPLSVPPFPAEPEPGPEPEAPVLAAPEPEPEPPPAPEPAAPAPAPEPAPADEVRSYVREVPLPDGGTLRLNGIAFSAARPVALIDDKVLAKGESYQGFVVTDIQADSVQLRGNGMTVRVSLK